MMASLNFPAYDVARSAHPTSAKSSNPPKVKIGGDYFRNTILAKVERLASDAALADEKERLERIQRNLLNNSRGRSEEHTHTPPVTE
ncbi:hypothetical protein TWF730_001672 [Orbilia blumenaviensis]|uniref:DET1- and DDB1-associated protein 1 n=1 Tax=Orbilia blumenaviensis TaxID=1796055 RepID=A0AAV9UM17_9PEZI